MTITHRIIDKLQQVAAHERMLADNARTSETLAQMTTDEQRRKLAQVADECDKLADEAIEAGRILQPHVEHVPAPTERRRAFRLLKGARS